MISPKPSSAPIIVHVFGRTDVGRTREHNEDAFVIADLTTDRATLLPEVRTHTVGDRGTTSTIRRHGGREWKPRLP